MSAFAFKTPVQIERNGDTVSIVDAEAFIICNMEDADINVNLRDAEAICAAINQRADASEIAERDAQISRLKSAIAEGQRLHQEDYVDLRARITAAEARASKAELERGIAEDNAFALQARVKELGTHSNALAKLYQDERAKCQAALNLAETAVHEAVGTLEGIRGESQHCDACHAFERATEWINNWHGGARVFAVIHAVKSGDYVKSPCDVPGLCAQMNRKCDACDSPHPDTEIVDWIAAHWDSQRVDPQPLLAGRYIANPTGSFRDAVCADRQKQNHDQTS